MYEGPEPGFCGVPEGGFRLFELGTSRLRDLVKEELLVGADIIEEASRPKKMVT